MSQDLPQKVAKGGKSPYFRENPAWWKSTQKFNSSPLKCYQNSIGKRLVFQPPFLKGSMSNFGGVSSLVGGFNPSEKYERQIGSFPQVSGWKFKKYWRNHHLVKNQQPIIARHSFNILRDLFSGSMSNFGSVSSISFHVRSWIRNPSRKLRSKVQSVQPYGISTCLEPSFAAHFGWGDVGFSDAWLLVTVQKSHGQPPGILGCIKTP